MFPSLNIPDETIGVAGDWHGNLGHAFQLLPTFHQRGVRTVIQLGDFGFTWADSIGVGLRKLDRILSRLDMNVLWLDGNHEDFVRLERWDVDDRGVRPMTERITHLPRGTRLGLAGGVTAAVLGGAGSYDITGHRVAGKSWWPQEAISAQNLHTLGSAPVDVLFGHEVPLALPVVGHDTSVDAEYTASVREMFNRGFEQVRPRLTVGGHWHQHLERTVRTIPADGRGEFTTRMVALDRDNDFYNLYSFSQALLSPASLQLDAFMLRAKP